MSLRTRAGSLKASVCAMNPPIDHPSTLARTNSSASITRAVSPASLAMSNGAPSSVEAPMPRLSRRIISYAVFCLKKKIACDYLFHDQPCITGHIPPVRCDQQALNQENRDQQRGRKPDF